MLFIVIIFFMEDYSMMKKIILFVVIQGLYFSYIIILRPQGSIKENLNDFINEIFYLYFVAFLLYFNTEGKWTSASTDAYFWILLMNNFILIFIMLVSLVKSMIIQIHKFIWKRKVNPKLKDQTTHLEINETIPYHYNKPTHHNNEEAKEEYKYEMDYKTQQIKYGNKVDISNKIESPQKISQKIQSRDLLVEDIEEAP